MPVLQTTIVIVWMAGEMLMAVQMALLQMYPVRFVPKVNVTATIVRMELPVWIWMGTMPVFAHLATLEKCVSSKRTCVTSTSVRMGPHVHPGKSVLFPVLKCI